MLSTLIILSFLGAANALFGPSCNSSIQTVHNFNVTSYMGKWYEYSRTSTLAPPLYKCGIQNYTANDNGTITMIMTQRLFLLGDEVYKGTLTTTPEGLQNGKLNISFPFIFGTSVVSPIWILGTDYTNYAVFYSCINHVYKYVWVITREAHPASNVVEAAEKVLQNTGLQRVSQYKVTQDCQENVVTSSTPRVQSTNTTAE